MMGITFNITILYVVLLILLLFFSAMVSGAEVAFFSLTQTQLVHKKPSFKNQDIVKQLRNNPKKLLATILVANNFLNIAIVLLFASIGHVWMADIPASLRLFIEIVIVTFLILLFGEIVPKVYASRNNEKFANTMAKPIVVLQKIFAVFSVPMQAGSQFIENKLTKTTSDITVTQLSQALALTDEDETTDEEQKILKGIVSFGNTDTSQVMRPRMDIFALDISAPFQEIMTQITKGGYSRIPVFKENLDQIKGVLYVKDLLPYLNKTDVDWSGLIRTPFFVPENKKLDDLLKEFQEKRVHLAIVVDEYGGTSGVVSLEDIIEEIIGDISDEFDDDNLSYSKIDNNNFVFEGKTALKDIYRVTGVDAEGFEAHKGEAETIAGFVLEISGNFPKKNEKIVFKGCVFTIEIVDKKRIKQIKFTLPS